MILRGDKEETARPATHGGATLDELFRRAGVQSAGTLALIDPPNREAITSGTPRQLTYTQADRAISALAAKLCRLGLAADTVIAIQLPNTVEAIVTLLAVLRAGMIAVPVPLLWREHDLKQALGNVGAKAIITTTRVGAVDHANLAMQVAAELFPIRFVCAFGPDLPDGIVALDDIFTNDLNSVVPRSMRAGNAADHVAIVTFDVTNEGLVAVARSHAQLMAGGSSVFLEAGATRNARILSAIPPSSFAGLATSVLPWLLDGGTLSLHHGFDPATFAAQCESHAGGMVVLPGPALSAVAVAGDTTTVVALWRSPEQLSSAATWREDCALVDVSCFGETALIALRRSGDGLPADVPDGIVGQPNAAGALLETTRRSGTLALRGAMAPSHVFPPGAEYGNAPVIAIGTDGFIDTGFTCRLDPSSQSLTISGPPGGVTQIGGYRFRPADLDAQVLAADSSAAVVVLPHGIMAQQLAGRAIEPDEVRQRLKQNGANPLIAEAFRPRGAASAA